MRKIILLLAMLVGMVLASAAPAFAYQYGDPATYTLDYQYPGFYERPHSDKNGDGVIVFRYDVETGTTARDAWVAAKNDWNGVYTDHGSQGVRFLVNTGTTNPVELILDRRSSCPDDGRTGWYFQSETGPDVATFCNPAINGQPLSYFKFVGRHEMGHSLGLGHRGCDQKTVSVMTTGCNSPSWQIGPADIEVWEYLWL